MSLLLECNEIEKSYALSGSEGALLKALDKVSFSLSEGDRLGLVGLNGSGKSTLLKIISGITKPTAGQISLYKGVQSLSGFDSMLHQDMTGRENVRFQLKLMKFGKAHIDQAIAEVIEFSELHLFIDQPVKNYSSGMMLRLSFSILKVIQPEILLLDEVLAVGDMLFREKINVLMTEYFSKVSGIIMASHQLSEISQYCNKCLVLNKGKVEFYGKCDEALSYYNSVNAFFSGNQLQTDEVAIEKIWLNSPSAVYTTADEIELRIRLTKKQSESEIIPVIYIAGTYGNVLTDSPRFRADFTGNAQQAGVYEYKVTIPSGLLNTGTYYVTIILGSINKVELEAKNVSKFDVVQTDWEKNKKWEVPTFFPVRLQLNWVSDFYNN